MFMVNNMYTINIVLMLVVFPTLAFSKSQIDQDKKIKVTRALNKIETYIGHPFIKKCIETADLPNVSLPDVKYVTNTNENSALYTVQFNGKKLNPKIQIADKKISLEKTTDETGYYLTINKPVTEKRFNLIFSFQNQNEETIRYDLLFNNGAAAFIARLTNEQMERLCLRDQIWASYGISSAENNQYNNELDADLAYGNTSDSKSISIEYKKNLNSNMGLGFSYRYFPGNVQNTNQITTQNETIKWQSLEAALLWRTIHWSYATGGALIYPYLKAGLQQSDIPITHLSNAGLPSFSQTQLQQFTTGVGVNIFARNGLYYDINFSAKTLLSANKNISKDRLSYELGTSVSKLINKKFTVGLGFLRLVDQLDYKLAQQGFENTGQMNLQVSTFDLKLGWVF